MSSAEIAIGAAVGAIVAPIALVAGVNAIGFTSAGIIAGTPAAGIMAASGGAVAKGSACAVLQSVGAVGLSVPGIIIVSGVGAAAGAAIASGGLAPGSPAENIFAASKGAAVDAVGAFGIGEGGIVPGSAAANIIAASKGAVEKASDWAASQPIRDSGATIAFAAEAAARAAADAIGAFGIGEGGIVPGSVAAGIMVASMGVFEKASDWAALQPIGDSGATVASAAADAISAMGFGEGAVVAGSPAASIMGAV
ncbi:hypothetical protein BGZ58_004877, partial [Dissophora ornata]